MIERKDLKAILVIGGGIGLLVQPILANNFPNLHLDLLVRCGIFIFFLLFAPLALLVAKFLSRWSAALYQFAKFAAVGTLNSFIDVGIFNLETFFYGSSIIGTALFAVFKGISFLFATTNSFAWNKYWTFSSEAKPRAGEVSGFYAVAVIGWILNVGVATLVKSLGPVGTTGSAHVWVNIVAPLSGIAISFLWNFVGYKYFVFKGPALA